jgi:hypothetical protein
MANELNTVEDFDRFLHGGSAIFTITSKKTDKHYTYKVAQKKGGGGPFFVRVLANGDNTDMDSQKYLGFLGTKSINGQDVAQIIAGKKGDPTAPSARALNWVLLQVCLKGEMPTEATVQHEGRCCACGRRLTDPTSIDLGIGPECRRR